MTTPGENDALYSYASDLESSFGDLAAEMFEVAKEIPFVRSPLMQVNLCSQLRALTIRYENLIRTMISLKGMTNGETLRGH